MIKMKKIKMNKKALSQVVATVLIVMLSIIAASTIGYIVIDLAKAPSLSPQASCLDISLLKPVKIESACYNNKTSEIELKMSRSMENLEISSLSFMFSSQAGSSKKWLCSSDCANCNVLQKGETKIYYLNAPSLMAIGNSSITLSTQGCLLDRTEFLGLC